MNGRTFTLNTLNTATHTVSLQAPGDSNVVSLLDFYLTMINLNSELIMMPASAMHVEKLILQT